MLRCRLALGLLLAVIAVPGSVLRGQESLTVTAAPLDETAATELTPTTEIRRLSREEAERGRLVRVRGTVTTNALEGGYCIQDATGPLFIFTEKKWGGLSLNLGDVVVVEGETDPGRHSPQVKELRRSVVGSTALPEPRVLTYERLISGREDNYYAAIQGVVRRVTVLPGEPQVRELGVAMGEGRVEVSVLDRSSSDLNALIDARVRLRGMVAGGLNQKGQWVRARFTVSRAQDISVLEPAPADPFALPLRPITGLLRWNLHHAEGHRVRVQGVVTHFRQGETMFIRDEENGLQVQLRGEVRSARRGNVVDVVGFPALGSYSAVLEDSTFRIVGNNAHVSPLRLTAEEMLNGDSDAGLVQVRGTLLESVRRQNERTLVVQSGNIVFTASVHQSTEVAGLDDLQPGALLELTGICLVGETVNSGRLLQPQNFALLLRDADDIVVLKQPPWWTTERLMRALLAVAVLALVILVWVWMLRRQVQTQAAILSDKAQREAVLAERSRLAREFHDTLEQDLTGVSLQLEVATMQAEGTPVLRQLKVAHRLLQRSQTEVRQSVWDLRRANFMRHELAEALREGLEQSVEGSATQLRFATHGEVRRLPGVKEHHVLRIGREAAANAIKHANADVLKVDLHYGEAELRLVIEDDGCGFVHGQVPGSESGHFGLLGMQERAGKLGGRLQLTSRPGDGTRVELTVSLRLPSKATAGPSNRSKSAASRAPESLPSRAPSLPKSRQSGSPATSS